MPWREGFRPGPGSGLLSTMIHAAFGDEFLKIEFSDAVSHLARSEVEFPGGLVLNPCVAFQRRQDFPAFGLLEGLAGVFLRGGFRGPGM